MPLLEQVLERYPRQVKVVFKNYPLRKHKYARSAALAALAAGEQGKFWEFHDQLFRKYRQLNDQTIDQIAKQLALDEPRFQRDRASPTLAQQVQADMDEARRVGVRGTPTVFVNGRLVKDRSVDGISALVEAELRKSEGN